MINTLQTLSYSKSYRPAFATLLLIANLYAISALAATPDPQASACVSGDPKSDHLIESLEKAKKSSAVTQFILQTDGAVQKVRTESGAPCVECLDGINKKFSSEALANIAKYGSNNKSLNLKCLVAAAQFTAPDTPEIACPEGSGKSAKNSCVNSELLSYQASVISNMYACISKYSSSPINPSSLFEIQALESTYKPNYTSRKGHGLGQLTDIFIEDAQQEGRGRTVMKKIAKDTSAECAAAREILGKDIIRKPRLSTPLHRCRFIELGEGMERNILYSFIGLNTLWRNNISKNFVSYSTAHATNPALPRLMERLLQIGFGPGGTVAALAAIKSGKHLSPERFLKLLDAPMTASNGVNVNQYLINISERQKKIGEKIEDKTMKEKFMAEGAQACL